MLSEVAYVCGKPSQQHCQQHGHGVTLDTVQESKHFEGQVLVAREAENNSTGGTSHVVDTYEPVAGLQPYCVPTQWL